MKITIVELMGIEMPGENGIKDVSLVKDARPETSVIMCTVFENDEKLFECVCAGTNGYLLKKTRPDKLFNAIKEVMEGDEPTSPSIIRNILNGFQTPKAANRDELTEREIQVLRLLTDGYSSRTIAKKMNIELETVRSHLKNIYQKLDVNGDKEAIGKALKERIL